MGKGVRENTLFFILFQRPTHFYLKKSDSTERTEKEMRRRTVYWQPDIKIKKGKADIIFTAPPQAPPPVNGDTGHIRQWETDNSKQNIIII